MARDYCQRLRARLGKNLVSVILYGSRARGDARDGSDFDLIVCVRERTKQAREIVLDVDVEMMNEHDELFVGTLYSEAEWARTRKFPFGRNVDREGLAL